MGGEMGMRLRRDPQTVPTLRRDRAASVGGLFRPDRR